MPNWCFTHYKIFGDGEQRKKLYSIFEELDNAPESRIENGFGNLWLGNVVDYLGGDPQEVYCRGEITGYNNYDEYLEFFTSTAWAEMHEFRHFLEGFYPDLEFYYMSEESGMCEYYTNDRSGSVFHDRYILDIGSDNWSHIEYFATLEEAAEFLNGIEEADFNVKPEMESIRKALEDYENEKDEDFYHVFEEFQYED